MQYKCDCANQGDFVAVNSNWDLGCPCGSARSRGTGQGCASARNQNGQEREERPCGKAGQARTGGNQGARCQNNMRVRRFERDQACEGSAQPCASRSGKERGNQGVGMVYAAVQKLDEIFESESALHAGTLFPELLMPMNGCRCGSKTCSTCAQQAAFAAWEVRLYLNTHPCDRQALALFRRLMEEAQEPNYATTFLDKEACGETWTWVSDPWPWELEGNCCD